MLDTVLSISNIKSLPLKVLYSFVEVRNINHQFHSSGEIVMINIFIVVNGEIKQNLEVGGPH